MYNTRTILPAAPLRDYVTDYVLRSEHLGSQVVVRPVTARPDVVLVFQLDSPTEAFEYSTGQTRVLPTALVVGPQTGRRAELMTSGDGRRLVVRFRPGGFHRLFHVSVEQIADTAIDACAVIGADAGRLCQRLAAANTDGQRVRLIDEFLATRTATARPRHPIVDAAATILDAHGACRVSDVIRASGLSDRQFERSFREQMGISPKLFARAARLEFALSLKRVNPAHTWTQVSQEAGYFDQTHFVKDFKALAGETPSSFPLTERILPSLGARRPA